MKSAGSEEPLSITDERVCLLLDEYTVTDPIRTAFVTSVDATTSTHLWMDEVERTSSTEYIAADHPLSPWTAPFEPASNGMPSAHELLSDDNISPIGNVQSETTN